MPPTRSTFSKKRLIIAIIIIAVILGGIGAYHHYKLLHQDQYSGAYQAVFLTNNQVYFGKVSNKNSRYVILSDIYYFQLTQPLQTQGLEKQLTQAPILVKLGSEIHAPYDRMEINRDQILFIEDLKSESQVVTAIQNYKKSKGL